MKWYNPIATPPPTGVWILVELDGNKLWPHLKIMVREGQGLGHIKAWRHLTEEEKTK